jgi:hypothetical protein
MAVGKATNRAAEPTILCLEATHQQDTKRPFPERSFELLTGSYKVVVNVFERGRVS